MKPSKKKPAKKSNKGKSPGGVPVKKKATTKKTVRATGRSKPAGTRVKSSEKNRPAQTEIQRLSGQLKQKERELEIEAALERVRSRSMAMRQSSELGDLSFELVKQVQALGIATWHCAFNIYDEGQESSTEWGSNANGSYPIYKTPREGIFKRYYEIGQRGETLHVEVIGEDRCADHYAYLCTLPGVGDTLVKLRDSGTPFPKSQIDHVAYFKYGYLLFITFVPVPDAHDVFKRFAKVFEQTYTRFLDLQKAEAQAKEAQIEAALERVRSRSMGMQRSEELKEVIQVVYDQFIHLNIPIEHTGFIMDYKSSDDMLIWLADQHEVPSQITIPYFDSPHWNSFNEAREKGKGFFANKLTFEEKNRFYEKLFEFVPGLPEETKEYYFGCPGLAISTVLLENIGLYIENFSGIPYSEEENSTLMRFGKVFQQTYTRFLDLQKAEAQARESQIEAALERVRSRTMAMQKSQELPDAANLLFHQVQTLGMPAWSAGYCIWDEDKQGITLWMSSEGVIQPPFHAPLSEDPSFIHMREAYQRGETFHVEELGGEACKVHYEYMRKLPVVGEILDSIIKAGHPLPAFQIFHCSYFTQGFLLFITYEAVPEAWDIFKRFAKVFEQTYTRFLDLQKAEAQTREAQIETALEKVRSTSLAMHRSDELEKVVLVLFEKLAELGLSFDGATICLFDKGKRNIQFWIATKFLSTPIKVDLPYDEDFSKNPIVMDLWRAIETGEHVLNKSYTGKAKDDYFRYTAVHNESRIPESVREFHLHAESWTVTFAAEKNSIVGFDSWSGHITLDADFQILKRFARVFEQCYTRFLDLKKAEAQAREAQIEASLERVRSKTMAMHNSHDVGDTVANVFDELIKLGVKTNRCGILIFSDSSDTEVWTAKSTPAAKVNLIIGHLNVTLHPLLSSAHTAWKNKETFFSYEMIGDDLIRYYQMINNQPGYPIQVNMEALPSKEIHSEFYFPEGAVFAFTSELIAPDDAQIFKRLAGVFGQTYRRYLDLKKAEAQARESQIEAALERVRSRTMAMHRSEEIADIVGKILKELTLLDVALNRVLIWIFKPDEKYFEWWSANPEAESNSESYRVDYNDHPVFLAYFEAWQKRQPLLLYTLGGTLKESFEDHLFRNTELSRLPKAVQDGMRSEKKIFTTSAISDFGLLMAGCFEPFSDEVNDIIQRFGRVFQQSYTRYVDVQKAEAQAREATIEASLEKVRGKAMAMHNSNDLASTASLVFTELRKLGINSFRNGVGLLTKENRNVKLYSATSSEDGGTFSVVGWAVLDNHPVLSKTYDSWINNEDYFPILKGESLRAYYEKVVATFTVPVEQSEGYEQHGYFLPFSEGLFYGWSEKPFTEQEIKILNRFRGIVDLTFRRYIELQKSEENAKEAIRQASLDRVRAEIASMRTTTDLDRITPLIWKELNTLSIPFVRCGVFIMDELQHQMHTFLSTPDGKAIAAFHLPFDSPGNVGQILSHWQNKKMYIEHWDEKAFSELGDLLIQQKAIPSKEIYMSTVPGEGVHLHCLPFLQGMLYVGNTAELQEDDIHMIQSVADAFSTAYARYEDFNKLESAKAQIEKTFTDLKQTQNLLVQSEKMASLGELTAGIAHEIQNPLNFVNNFSEVSNELLEEMKDEIAKGNYDEVEALTNNIKQNLEKILHHGKRADGIVKGMLQHSRSSTGVKEPTDINALADEYLRLAYHGFRAKDKGFNASTNTDLDRSIGNINVVPQDIGRVVLNLITNAFFAVTEKQKHTGGEYQPTISVSTKRHEDCVLISVKDNGNGIPKQIREKIFQPFFTTKPTGQGTGLGLSLSYDIVKAHGGELRMETTEGEGSEFVVSIMV